MYVGSEVQIIPVEPIRYVCRSQRALPKSERTVFHLRVMSHKDTTQHLARIGAMRRELGPQVDASVFTDAQDELLRERCVRIENLPDGTGKRNTLEGAAERTAALERLPGPIVQEVLTAIQSWSAAREGLLGNCDSVSNGHTPPTTSGA